MKKLISIPVLLLFLLCFLAVGSAENSDAKPLKLNRGNSAPISSFGDAARFSFVPEEPGIYLLTSSGGGGTHTTLYDPEHYSYIGGDYESICELEAGKQYFYDVRFLEYNRKGTVNVKLTKVDFRWTLEDGVLTLSGKCPVPSFGEHPAPWFDQRELVTSVVMENGITRFTMDDFSDCVNLKSISVPASVSRLHAVSSTNYIHRCLTDIEVDKKNRAFMSENGVLFNKKKTELILYPAGKAEDFYQVPDQVTDIDCDAFKGCGLKEIVLPERLKSINVDAFKDSSLTAILIPAKVTYIYTNPFMGCSSLTEITVAEENWVFTSRDGILYSKETNELLAYPAGKPENSFTVPGDVPLIGVNAFSTCENLTSIIIPDTVTRIDDEALYFCGSLQDVYYGGTKENWKEITDPNPYNDESHVDPYEFLWHFATLHCADTPDSAATQAAEAGNPPQKLFGWEIPRLPKWDEIDQYSLKGNTLTITTPWNMVRMELTEANSDWDEVTSVSVKDNNTISMNVQDLSNHISLITENKGYTLDRTEYRLRMEYEFLIQDGKLSETYSHAEYQEVPYPHFLDEGTVFHYNRQKDINSLRNVRVETDGETIVRRENIYTLYDSGWIGEFHYDVHSPDKDGIWTSRYMEYDQYISGEPHYLLWATVRSSDYSLDMDRNLWDADADADMYILSLSTPTEEDWSLEEGELITESDIKRRYPAAEENNRWLYGTIYHYESNGGQVLHDEINWFIYPEGESLLLWRDGKLILNPETRDLNGNPLPIPDVPGMSVLEKIF